MSHTLATRIRDEVELFADVESVPRMYCWECARSTPFRRGFEGSPICVECEEKEYADTER